MLTEVEPSGRLVVRGDLCHELFLAAFWAWVRIFAAGDDERTVNALFWGERSPSVDFLSMYASFWGGGKPWRPVVPNARLVAIVNDAAEIEFPATPSWHEGAVGWGMAQVPVTTTPDRALDDDVELMGIATSFFLREVPGGYALEYEIVHV
ncbi:MAG: hypothetical protein KTR31_32725 [Myxococcales bacterium]|nr:hypothetical protein [Myxococcales bacterium]